VALRIIESCTLSVTDRRPPTSKMPKDRFEGQSPRFEGLIRLAALPLLFLVFSVGITAQTPAPSHRLSDYVGTYSDSPGHTLEIVAGDELFAVLDEAKYLLHALSADEFATITGEKIPFRRDSAGNVTGYEEHGTFHPRISTSVSPESAALAYPRPAGQNSPADYRYHPPADLHDGIAVEDIAQSALGTTTADAIVRGILDGTYKDVHSVLLYHQGKLVMEEYFYGYSVGRPHQLRSATKSVVSALAGIAIDTGTFPGVDEPVLPHVSYTSYANPDPRKAAITLGEFLSMSSGLDCNDHSSTSAGREMVIDETPDWVKATLDLPMINDPGTHGFYCSGGVAVVGRVTENAVHAKLPDFAQSRLFGPLGISRADWVWNYDLTNQDKEYSQIHLRSRDMLKLGILFANGGRWQGRQIISESWVRASLAEHSHVDNVSYGYFWWRPWLNVDLPGGTQRVDVIAAQGNGGQKIYLVPQFDLVAVFTGGGYNAESTPPNTIMAKIILPALIQASTATHGPSPSK
jgi:CubicO group peptidase (beta-lactamase class C family)